MDEDMNRDLIKLIAALLMVFNHIAYVFLERGTLLFGIFRGLGHITCITMCWFLVEGYRYTKDLRKYLVRMAVFAAIAQIPFTLAFHFRTGNILVNLLLCLLLMAVLDGRGPAFLQDPLARKALAAVLFIPSVFLDWGPFAPFFVIMFRKAQGGRITAVRAWAACILASGYLFLTEDLSYVPFVPALAGALYGMAMQALGGLLVLKFYNGQRAERGRKFFQWFFYVFYPLHLLILVLVREFFFT